MNSTLVETCAIHQCYVDPLGVFRTCTAVASWSAGDPTFFFFPAGTSAPTACAAVRRSTSRPFLAGAGAPGSFGPCHFGVRGERRLPLRG